MPSVYAECLCMLLCHFLCVHTNLQVWVHVCCDIVCRDIVCLWHSVLWHSVLWHSVSVCGEAIGVCQCVYICNMIISVHVMGTQGFYWMSSCTHFSCTHFSCTHFLLYFPPFSLLPLSFSLCLSLSVFLSLSFSLCLSLFPLALSCLFALIDSVFNVSHLLDNVYLISISIYHSEHLLSSLAQFFC